MPGPASKKTGFTRAGVRRPPSGSQDFDRATTGLPALGIESALDTSGIPNCTQDISLANSGLPSLGNKSAAEASLEEAAPTPATGQEAQVITLDSSGPPSRGNKSAAESSLEEAAPPPALEEDFKVINLELRESIPWERACGQVLPGGISVPSCQGSGSPGHLQP